MAPPPAKLMVEAICQAAMTFPVGIGLGWDGIHPRAICRLSQYTLEWLARVLYYCETTGKWPALIDVVIIALLPKSDGGAVQWEKDNQHPFLYVGKGMGADIAACKQAARAELATTAQFKVGYAQALLDLVEAFDRIPHWLIVDEAKALGYPRWFIRLSLQTYKLK